MVHFTVLPSASLSMTRIETVPGRAGWPPAGAAWTTPPVPLGLKTDAAGRRRWLAGPHVTLGPSMNAPLSSYT